MSYQIEKYRDLCRKEASIPIFSQDWWLDVTAGHGNWDVSIVERDGEIIAAMPFMYTITKKFILITQPPLTQSLGPWLGALSAKYAKRLGQEKDLFNELIAGLPLFDHFSQNWHFKYTNWLPFFWKGFQQTTKYTYVLPDLSDREKLWSGLQENIRTDIRKAQIKFNLKIRSDLTLDHFIALHRLTFERQNIKLPVSLDLIRQLDQACLQKGARKIFIAEDALGKHHAGVYIVWDSNSAYYLMGGGDPALRNSGATSLCLWSAVQFSSTVTKSFNFEGSMIESIERFFRGFGPLQKPYFSISKTPSRILRIRAKLSELLLCFK
jgi:hypothetical protein